MALHLVISSERPLFSGALLESASPGLAASPQELYPRARAFMVVRAPRPSAAREPATTPQANASCTTLGCLRGKSVTALAVAFDALFPDVRPVVDGALVRDYPLRLLTSGQVRWLPPPLRAGLMGGGRRRTWACPLSWATRKTRARSSPLGAGVWNRSTTPRTSRLRRHARAPVWVSLAAHVPTQVFADVTSYLGRPGLVNESVLAALYGNGVSTARGSFCLLTWRASLQPLNRKKCGLRRWP